MPQETENLVFIELERYIFDCFDFSKYFLHVLERNAEIGAIHLSKRLVEFG